MKTKIYRFFISIPFQIISCLFSALIFAVIFTFFFRELNVIFIENVKLTIIPEFIYLPAWLIPYIIFLVGLSSMLAFLGLLSDETLKEPLDLIKSVHITCFFLCWILAMWIVIVFYVMPHMVTKYDWYWFTPHVTALIWTVLIMLTIIQLFCMYNDARIDYELEVKLGFHKNHSPSYIDLPNRDLYSFCLLFVFFIGPVFMFFWIYIMNFIYYQADIFLTTVIELQHPNYLKLVKAITDNILERKSLYHELITGSIDIFTYEFSIEMCKAEFAQLLWKVEDYQQIIVPEAQAQRALCEFLVGGIWLVENLKLLYVGVLLLLMFFFILCSLAVDQNFKKGYKQRGGIFYVTAIFQLFFNFAPAFAFFFYWFLPLVAVKTDSIAFYISDYLHNVGLSNSLQLTIVIVTIIIIFLWAIYLTYLTCETDPVFSFEEIRDLRKKEERNVNLIIKQTSVLIKMKFYCLFMLIFWTFLLPLSSLVFYYQWGFFMFFTIGLLYGVSRRVKAIRENRALKYWWEKIKD